MYFKCSEDLTGGVCTLRLPTRKAFVSFSLCPEGEGRRGGGSLLSRGEIYTPQINENSIYLLVITMKEVWRKSRGKQDKGLCSHSAAPLGNDRDGAYTVLPHWGATGTVTTHCCSTGK